MWATFWNFVGTTKTVKYQDMLERWDICYLLESVACLLDHFILVQGLLKQVLENFQGYKLVLIVGRERVVLQPTKISSALNIISTHLPTLANAAQALYLEPALYDLYLHDASAEPSDFKLLDAVNDVILAGDQARVDRFVYAHRVKGALKRRDGGDALSLIGQPGVLGHLVELLGVLVLSGGGWYVVFQHVKNQNCHVVQELDQIASLNLIHQIL